MEAIEGHLRARRGVDHILSPRDFALARAWYAGRRAAGHRAGGHGPRLRGRAPTSPRWPTAGAGWRSWRPPGPAPPAAPGPARGERPARARWRAAGHAARAAGEGAAGDRALPSTRRCARSARCRTCSPSPPARTGATCAPSCARSTTTCPPPSLQALSAEQHRAEFARRGGAGHRAPPRPRGRRRPSRTPWSASPSSARGSAGACRG